MPNDGLEPVAASRVACDENSAGSARRAERSAPALAIQAGRTGVTEPRWKWALILLSGLAALWALAFAGFALWRFNAPLNDDMFYAHGAFLFVRGGGVHYWGVSTMPLVGQWAWSWPFLKVLGESHVSLRVSTVVLSVLGVVAFCDLLLQAGLAPPRAAFVAACLALDPLFFLLTPTYMADVPSLSLSLAAMALYGRALAGGRLDLLGAGTAVALVGAVTRQQSVAVPLAVGVSLVLGRPRLRSRPLWLLAVALPLAAAAAAHVLLQSRHDIYKFEFSLPSGVLRPLLLAFTLLVYLGLAAVPVLALGRGTGRRTLFLAAAAGLIAFAAYGWAFDAYRGGYTFIQKYDGAFLFPYTGNMISPWGTCLEFMNVPIVLGNKPLLLPLGVRVALSAAGCVSGAALLARAARGLRSFTPVSPLPAFTAVSLALILVIPASHSVVDRYILPLVPGALLLACDPPATMRPRWKSGLAALAMFGVLSVGLAHDWFAWNLARWDLGQRALRRGVAFQEIEGGCEFNQENHMRYYSKNRERFRDREPVLLRDIYREAFEHASPRPSHSLSLAAYRNINTGRYGLSFSILPGTRVLDSEPFTLWLVPGGGRKFYLLEALP